MSDEPATEHENPTGARPARSLVVVNTGDGKGKSTAAFGVMLRALAQGWDVAVVQFLKSGRWKVGEEKIALRLGVDWWSLGDGFTWDSENLDRDRAVAMEAWRHARSVIEAGRHRLVVLDEVTYPINWNWIDGEEVARTIAARPERVSIVATGREAPTSLLEVADTVTEMHKVRHAYDAGVLATKGIDY